MDQQLSEIEKLPEELIQAIFDHAPKSVMTMRQVSKHMQQRVDGYVQRVGSIQLVDSLEISVIEESTRILIWVLIENSDLFELRIKHIVVSNGFSIKQIDRTKYDTSSSYAMMTDDLTVLAHINTSMGGLSDSSSKSGSIRRLVNLDCCNDETHRGHIRELLSGLSFRDLRFNGKMSDSDAYFINKIIEDHNVDMLSLLVERPTLSDPVNVLRGFASSVRRLSLTQFLSVERSTNSTFLFGLADADWVKIIIEMMESNLNTLSINYGCKWLSEAGEEELKRYLPNLDKKVWFEACRHQISEFEQFVDYVENEHSVKVERSTLFIKHNSRIREFFDGDCMENDN